MRRSYLRLFARARVISFYADPIANLHLFLSSGKFAALHFRMANLPNFSAISARIYNLQGDVQDPEASDIEKKIFGYLLQISQEQATIARYIKEIALNKPW